MENEYQKQIEEIDGDELQEVPVLTKADKIEIIKSSIRYALKISDQIKPTDTLVLSLYNILQDYFVNDKKYVIAELPTGSGKSVIGYLLHYCYVFCSLKIDCFCSPQTTYFLTSSKMLQKQIENDFDRFNLHSDFKMLKGTSNYECVYFEIEKLEQDKSLNKLGLGDIVKESSPQQADQKVMYDKRFCLGMSLYKKKNLNCYELCPYIVARNLAASSPCAVLNYAYFLNVRRSDASPFFSKRSLTICDEGHLLPDIVCNLFQFEITKGFAARVMKLLGGITSQYSTVNVTTGSKPAIAEDPNEEENCQNALKENREYVERMMQFFDCQLRTIDGAIEYYYNVKSIAKNFAFLLKHGNSAFKDLHEKQIRKLFDGMDNLESQICQINELATRPNDIYIKSEIKFGTNYYAHIVKDMSEAKLVNENFVKKIDRALIMSATLGNIDEYAKMLGLNQDDYSAYRIESTFDFTKSPIYLCKSGYLNFTNFNENINGVIKDCIYICENYHPNDFGIIHTSTFKISDMIRDEVLLNCNSETRSRFLFYKTPEEKEKCVAMIVESQAKGGIPYIIVGASLYEGLDLKYDQGRFNIMVKVPFPGMDDYGKAKMERMPFWYSRITIEKLVQAIGRTNRATDDWSKVYLLDSSFEKQIMLTTGNTIKNRLQYLNIPREEMKPKDTKPIYRDEEILKDVIKADDENYSDDLPF